MAPQRTQRNPLPFVGQSSAMVWFIVNQTRVGEPAHHARHRRRRDAEAVGEIGRGDALVPRALELVDRLEAVLNGLRVRGHLNNRIKSQRLSPAMRIVASHATTISHCRLTNSPIFERLDVNCTRGTTANESWRLSTT